MKNGKIFTQIASYRDPQLLLTLRDCIDKAYQPENLVFCICWQHDQKNDPWDTLDEFKDDPRFKIIDIEAKEGKGACWARNLIQQQYDNEEYTLQLDSHHRFVQNWDVELITMLRQLKKDGVKKPLLTSYLPSFNPENDPAERTLKPYMLTLDRFIPEGCIFFLPATIDNFEVHTRPLACRFYSAHFCFTLGEFSQEVQHDPELYFHGEEISIAVRAYTHGYDLYSPHRMVAWHEYTRKGRTKHWDDHSDWNKKNDSSHLRVRKLFGIDGTINDIDFGKYGLGIERTLEDYERYAGVCFKNRSVQQYTLDHKLPPNPVINDPEEYKKSFLNVFKHCINVHSSVLPDKYKFIAVIFEDEKENSIHRQDIVGCDLEATKAKEDGFYKIWRTFNYEDSKKPYKYIVWPFLETTNEWGKKIEEIIYK